MKLKNRKDYVTEDMEYYEVIDNNIVRHKGMNRIQATKATPFQLKVWQALLRIPFGGVSTYSNLAKNIQLPNGSRAIGTACGSNPVAYLIPCHRVIKSTGIIGDYRWGSARKTAILGWEAAKLSSAV